MQTLFSLKKRLRLKSGFSLVETLIALAISSVAMILLVQINVMASRFAAEGFREVKLLNDASSAVEKMTRFINESYRLDADNSDYKFSIQNSYQTLEFSIPAATGSTINRERLRFDSGTSSIRHERRNAGGTFVMVESTPLVQNVQEFAVDNQEGIISIVVRVRVTVPPYKPKQYTLIGRALPRNI